jgi:hypothetical protein
MVDRETSKETWVELSETILKIKRRARKNKDTETVKDAERCDALLHDLGIEIMVEDWKAETEGDSIIQL